MKRLSVADAVRQGVIWSLIVNAALLVVTGIPSGAAEWGAKALFVVAGAAIYAAAVWALSRAGGPSREPRP